MPNALHRIVVDHSESRSTLLDGIRRSGAFAVQLDHLPTGDYLIDNEALVERKSVGDLAASLIDGRLFPQVARLAHSGYRTLLLIEGPPPASMPDVNPHSIEGALVSIAAMWRLPVLHASDSEQSVLQRSRELTRAGSAEMDHVVGVARTAWRHAQEAPVLHLPSLVRPGPACRGAATGVLRSGVPNGPARAEASLLAAAQP